MPDRHRRSRTDTDYPHKWRILVAVGLTLFMGTVDGTIVNVALPTLTRDLNTAFATVQWVVLAFLLGLTVFLLGMGRLGDVIGKKPVFAAGLVLFLAGSLACGLAPGIYWLIGFRFLQAIGASMTLALGVAIVTETWPPYERGRAIGISAGIISLGIAAGPALGGLILQALSWRWIFFVNLPVGLVALFLVITNLPRLAPAGKAPPFDLAGAISIGLSMLAFALAMTVGQQRGFLTAPVVGLLAACVLLLALFVWQERRAPYPMIDLSLFQEPNFSLNLLTGVLTFVAIAGVVLLLPFYLVLVMGLEQRDVGLLMAVVPMVLGVLGPLSGTLSDRHGTRPISVLGLMLLVLGYVALTHLDVNATPSRFVLLLLPVGLGMGTFQSPNNTAIMNAVPRNRLGIASGILSMSRTLGQTTGIALLGAFFAARLKAHAGAPVDIASASPETIVLAMHDQFYLVVGLVAAGLTLALWRWWVERRAPRGVLPLPDATAAEDHS
ncbi:MAG: DHA2 family efflux MFS transporter permease subunit [Caldilineae bacterium]|nr:MAG: DHA2 family efflux MFS transporter permease subunit [Caldilineae bacterium]